MVIRTSLNFAPDLLGVMVAGLMFGTQIMRSSLKPFFSGILEVICFPSAPFVTSILWALVNLVYFALILLAVHYISKIPVVGRIFKFPDLNPKAAKNK